MGLTLKINTILRFEIAETLEVGKEYVFEKEGLRLLADDMQIWLTKNDWTVLADILITSQLRKVGKTTGTFIVKHVYSGEEQSVLSDVFKRMYSQS